MAKEIVLALGSGGVRGCAHIGAYRCLLDHGYKIKGISGSSAGGLFGAAFASGADLDLIEKTVLDFFKNPDFSRRRGDVAFGGTGTLQEALSPIIGDKNIEDFPIPFIATAVSITTGEQVIITKGNAIKAVLATIAIPGFFPSQSLEEEVLVDGAVLDPVPVDIARRLDPTLPVVAVPLHYKPHDFKPDQMWLPFSQYLPKSVLNHVVSTHFGEIMRSMNASLELAISRMAQLSLEETKPDVIVKPLVGHYGALEPIDPAKLVEEGYRAMEQCLPDLNSSYSLLNTFLRITKYGGLKKPKSDTV